MIDRFLYPRYKRHQQSEFGCHWDCTSKQTNTREGFDSWKRQSFIDWLPHCLQLARSFFWIRSALPKIQSDWQSVSQTSKQTNNESFRFFLDWSQQQRFSWIGSESRIYKGTWLLFFIGHYSAGPFIDSIDFRFNLLLSTKYSRGWIIIISSLKTLSIYPLANYHNTELPILL